MDSSDKMETYLKIILAVGLVVVLIAIFVITYLINKNTKEQEGCPKLDVGGCEGCMLSCSKREEEASLGKIVKNISEGFTSDDKKGNE